MKKYKLAVFIGRFQPLHDGHLTVIKKALEEAEQLLVIVGSCYGPRTLRNPFTYDERKDLIVSAVPPDVIKYNHLLIRPAVDSLYNDEKWVEQIQEIVYNVAPFFDNNEIALVGYEKDHTSFYLKLFPQWGSISVEQEVMHSSTEIREMFYRSQIDHTQIPTVTSRFLSEFFDTTEYVRLVLEYKFVQDYRRAWEFAPYPPTFVTTDAVVVQSGHILLVKRRALPGKGLWALPGGFLNVEEKIIDGMIRELKEETKIKVPEAVLRGSIRHVKCFDDPHRSPRGRIITHAGLIHLKPDVQLPKVRGSDDAAVASWIPLANVRRSDMFSDHYSIIENMTAVL
jgi:bifunctional NMN adenylyltransferase/nudix hydrolase